MGAGSGQGRRLDYGYNKRRISSPVREFLMVVNSEAAIFARILDPDRPSLSPDAARSILALDFTPEDRDRMNALADKARQGALTTDEDEEINNYIRAGHLLTLMQSKARISLKRANGQP